MRDMAKRDMGTTERKRTSRHPKGGGAASKPALPDAAAGRQNSLRDKALPAGLYLVATPIGHADDITLRALDVLRSVDAVACEDSRVTAKLLARHGIAAKLLSYHEHNAAKVRPRLIEELRAGGRIALVSDAGTPLVSDPGYKLVREAIAAGLNVVALPGPSAALTALLVSGLPSDRFFFAGFLPPRTAARRKALAELAAIPATLLFFETAPRLTEALDDMAAVLGDRPAAVARELTKLFEETRRGGLAELAAHYRAAGPPKGELVIVCGGASARAPSVAAESLDDRLIYALSAMSLKDAVATVADSTGLPRKQVYARALALSRERQP